MVPRPAGSEITRQPVLRSQKPRWKSEAKKGGWHRPWAPNTRVPQPSHQPLGLQSLNVTHTKATSSQCSRAHHGSETDRQRLPGCRPWDGDTSTGTLTKPRDWGIASSFQTLGFCRAEAGLGLSTHLAKLQTGREANRTARWRMKKPGFANSKTSARLCRLFVVSFITRFFWGGQMGS